jgi:hypothetical protein
MGVFLCRPFIEITCNVRRYIVVRRPAADRAG